MSSFEEINFDRTLGILQGWAGRRVAVSVDNALPTASGGHTDGAAAFA
jgi:hypothetical protein